MIDLVPRKKKILDLLLARDGWVTSQQMAYRLNLSDRTIRKEIADLSGSLETHGLSIASERGKGYTIRGKDKLRLNNLMHDGKALPLDTDYPSYIKILQSLLNENCFMDLDVLSDAHYFSRTAMENELKAIKKYLESYSDHLRINRKKNAVCIEGPEREKRMLINSLIVSDVHSNLSVDLKAYRPFFNEQHMTFCKDALCQLLEQYNQELQLTDMSIMAIVIHVMIAIGRIEQGFALTESYIVDNQNAFSDRNTELIVSNQLWDSVESHFRIKANLYEREAIAYLTSFRRVLFPQSIAIEDLENETTREYLQLARSIIAELRDVYLLDLTWDTDLLVGLTAHLKSLANRAKFKSHYVNPILNDFKDQYPFIFELAIYARWCIMTLKELNINEDEVGYLAIHFGASVERLKHIDQQGGIRTVLICHTGYANAKFLFAKLKSVFGGHLELRGPYSLSDKDLFVDDVPQLVLSTTDIDLPWKFGIRPIVVNPLLDRSDVEQIQKSIVQIERKSAGIGRMRQFFCEEHFHVHLPYKSSDEIIAFMSERLIDKGKVWPAFQELVFERENFSPTAIQNLIALPHPSAFCSFETTISVAILPRAVDWYGRKVQLVFLMAIKEGDQRYLKDFYEFIVDLSEDIGRVQRLLKITDLDTFWQFMLNDGANRKSEEIN